MGVKRFREEQSANCLMLLSKVGLLSEMEKSAVPALKPGAGGRIYECKTCKKQFLTFQALGGHRASHKKLRLMAADLLHQSLAVTKPKTHACSICGLEFPLGQALGGHMRRHRGAALDGEKPVVVSDKPVAKAVPFLMRSNSSKRIFGFEVDGLDLNLTPEDNDPDERDKFPPLLEFFV
uniref:Zinc finger DNA-binding protein n=1 Tax=Catharanthus roseus TaxID=4058 RepID=Q5TJD6_CATRO|nr:zinc finger DNA-binding protein [Catharanthus roseus]